MKLYKVTTTRKKGKQKRTDYINASCELDALRLANCIYSYSIVVHNISLIKS